VPWSVSWSGEQAFRLQPSRDFPGLTEVAQKNAPGEGEPLFAISHISRHRAGMVSHLCHVCGRPTDKKDRWIFPVATGGMVTLADGERRYGCNVPPVHRACGRIAAQLCPHLSHLHAQPVLSPGDEGRLVQRTDAVPGMEALAARLPPGAEVVFSCYRLYGPGFSRRVERLRREAGAPDAIGDGTGAAPHIPRPRR
jgi:hypothetical protein